MKETRDITGDDAAASRDEMRHGGRRGGASESSMSNGVMGNGDMSNGGGTRGGANNSEANGNSLRALLNVRGIKGVVYRLGELRRRTEFAARNAINYARLTKERAGARPGVTAVMVGRNDDYMPDFRQRLEATIEWNARYLADEIVFVEWNPPPERALLAERLVERFPFVRVYVVPPELHAEVGRGGRAPLLEYHAKNVGIRRARTDWVIATNADAAFGLDTVRTILHTPLSEDVVWTTERFDIPWREGREDEIGLSDCLRYRRPIPYSPLGTGEFAFASRRLWERVRGYDEAMTRHRIGVDQRGIAQMIKHGARSQRAGTLLHLAHPSSCTEGVRPHHGEWASLENLPYVNDENWGLGDRREVEIGERTWRLE